VKSENKSYRLLFLLYIKSSAHQVAKNEFGTVHQISGGCPESELPKKSRFSEIELVTHHQHGCDGFPRILCSVVIPWFDSGCFVFRIPHFKNEFGIPCSEF
jgi:hypothetical protein